MRGPGGLLAGGALVITAVAGASSAAEGTGWRHLEANATTDLTVQAIFGLKVDLDHAQVHAVHDPSHPLFRKFYSVERTHAARSAPAHQQCEAVLRDVAGQLNLTVGPSGRKPYFLVEGPAENVAELFKPGSLEFVQLQAPNGDQIVRAKMPSDAQSSVVNGMVTDVASTLHANAFPTAVNNQITEAGAGTTAPILPDLTQLLVDARLRDCVGMIARLTDIPALHKPSRRVLSAAGAEPISGDCETFSEPPSGKTITPAVLDTLYSVNSAPALPQRLRRPSASQGVLEATSSPFSSTDFACFLSAFGLPQAQVQLETQVGDILDANCMQDCDEANLDVQYMSAMNPGNDVEVFYATDLFDILYHITSENLPAVLSISYGAKESAIPPELAVQVCNEIGYAALRGTTIFVSSGDTGATDGTCTSYTVEFPASCPYVTAVGATVGFAPGTEVVAELSAGAIITSGGGFSRIFTDDNVNLEWQSANTTAYLNAHASASASGFATNGRGVPDIAAAGAFYAIVVDGNFNRVDGTSASAPVMAGLTARAMSELGLDRIGWINPLLYSGRAKFFDVVSGGNSGTESVAQCLDSNQAGLPFGFSAAPGWDPASGLGTLGVEGGYEAFRDLLAAASWWWW